MPMQLQVQSGRKNGVPCRVGDGGGCQPGTNFYKHEMGALRAWKGFGSGRPEEGSMQASGSFQSGEWITSLIKGFARDSLSNRLQEGRPEAAFAEPLVDFARGDDPPVCRLQRSCGAVLLNPC